jgi:REP element-mobilizing transposase RayT
MGEPPRLSEIRIPRDTSVVYFVTICVKGRRRVLANVKVYEAIKTTIGDLQRWRVIAGVVMSDHLHLVITPTEDRGLSAGDFASGFKRIFRKTFGAQKWEWQRGCFDRLLRPNDNRQSKWIYVEQNPIRAGLVENAGDWPYYLGSIEEQASWQIRLQKENW